LYSLTRRDGHAAIFLDIFAECQCMTDSCDMRAYGKYVQLGGILYYRIVLVILTFNLNVNMSNKRLTDVIYAPITSIEITDKLTRFIQFVCNPDGSYRSKDAIGKTCIP
jgi:hypothetical protein